MERYLRHQRFIPGSLRMRTTIIDTLSVLSAIVGSIGLVLLSLFNTFQHGKFHWSMTATFLCGALFSVLLQTLVMYDLAHSHKNWHGAFKQLVWPATIKLIILILALCVSVAFGCLYLSCNGLKYFDNVPSCKQHIAEAAGCEWTIAFLLVPYLLSYCYDFWPAKYDLGIPGFATLKRPAGVIQFATPGHRSVATSPNPDMSQSVLDLDQVHALDPSHPTYRYATGQSTTTLTNPITKLSVQPPVGSHSTDKLMLSSSSVHLPSPSAIPSGTNSRAMYSPYLSPEPYTLTMDPSHHPYQAPQAPQVPQVPSAYTYPPTSTSSPRVDFVGDRAWLSVGHDQAQDEPRPAPHNSSISSTSEQQDRDWYEYTYRAGYDEPQLPPKVSRGNEAQLYHNASSSRRAAQQQQQQQQQPQPQQQGYHPTTIHFPGEQQVHPYQ